MKKLVLLVSVVVLCSIPVFAGEFLMNEEVAYGLRVTFSEPVTITYSGDVLMVMNPQGEATDFVFSGAELPPWVGHGLAWSPSSARIASYEWLSSPDNTGAFLQSETAVPESYVKEGTLTATFTARDGSCIEGAITRRQSVESIPFWIEYELEGLGDEADCQWTLELPLDSDTPLTQYAEGRSVRFVSLSNARDHEVTLRITIDGNTYEWQETIDFPLHSQTQIRLDASQFDTGTPDSVWWSARNWTPDDVTTFPIADQDALATTMTSEWPNSIYVTCEFRDGSSETVKMETEALVYWRDGPPFEIRGMMAMYQGGLTDAQLRTVMDQQFPLLRDLGVNLIVHQHKEHYDRPGSDGSFDIHPLYRTWQEKWPEEGHTPPLDQLTTYLRRAVSEGPDVHVELRTMSYPAISAEYHGSGWGSEAGFMNTDGWLDALMEHYERTIPFFAGLQVDGRPVVTSMSVASEQGWVEEQGGATSRQFQADLLENLRDDDSDDPFYFTGGLSFVHSYFQNLDHPEWFPLPSVLLQPQRCGVYWDGCERLETSFYPTLADRRGATIQEMLDEMLLQIDRYLVPWSEAYGGKSLFFQDVQCNAVSGAGIWPVNQEQQFSEPYDSVEQLNWFAAILRGIAITNRAGAGRLFEGLSMCYYHVIPDSWLVELPPEWSIKQPYVNQANNRRDLQVFVKVHYADKPLTSEEE